MKRLAVVVAAVIACGALAQVQWNTRFADASRAARASGKPILVDFFAEWCGPCKAMEKDAFEDKTVVALMKRVVAVRLNVDDRPAEAARFKVNSIPRVLLLSSDGATVMMDLEGYENGSSFATELSHALGVKSAAVASEDPPALVKVRSALASNSYGSLRSGDPKTARVGMALLVERLGAYQEAQYRPVASLVQRAGRDAYPALVDGMGHKHLAVRVASYRMLLKMLGNSRPRSLAFDPWAKSGVRKAQLAGWQRWVRSRA